MIILKVPLTHHGVHGAPGLHARMHPTPVIGVKSPALSAALVQVVVERPAVLGQLLQKQKPAG